MPAGDGGAKTVADPACEWCGSALSGTVTVRVDTWSAFACQTCVKDGTADVPGTCALYGLPRATEGSA